MWKLYWSFALLLLLLLSACSAPLVQDSKQKDLMVGEPVGHCREVGSVRGSRVKGGGLLPSSDETGKNRMRSQASRMGANYVRLNNIDETWVTGTAYSCN